MTIKEKKEWLQGLEFDEKRIKMQLNFFVTYKTDMKYQVDVNLMINELIGALGVIQMLKLLIQKIETTQ